MRGRRAWLDEGSGKFHILQRSRCSHLSLQETLALEREYIILCHGQMPWGLSILRQGIRGIPLSGSIVSADGLPAETHTLPCAWLRGPGGEAYTLVAASIVTGRKHQIRVHLSHQGYPVVGDHRYGRHASHSAGTPGMSCRQFLFRYRIAVLGLGEKGEALQVALPLAPDLRAALHALQPLDEASASAWQQWTSGAKPLAFRELEMQQKHKRRGDTAGSWEGKSCCFSQQQTLALAVRYSPAGLLYTSRRRRSQALASTLCCTEEQRGRISRDRS